MGSLDFQSNSSLYNRNQLRNIRNSPHLDRTDIVQFSCIGGRKFLTKGTNFSESKDNCTQPTFFQ